jgi:hypothetical protein
MIEDSKMTINSILNKKDGNVMTKMMTIVKLLIEQVDEIKLLSGEEKKQLVITVIYEMIDDDDGPLDIFDTVLKPLIASAIDELILVGKTGLKFAPTSRGEKCSCLCFLDYFTKIFGKTVKK